MEIAILQVVAEVMVNAEMLGSRNMLIYKIVDPKKAVYKISDLYLAFNKLVETSLRNTISKMDLVQVIRRKNVVEEKVSEDLSFINKNWGIMITKFDLQEVIPPEQFVESNRKLEQEKRELIDRKENERIYRLIEEQTKSQVQQMDWNEGHPSMGRAVENKNRKNDGNNFCD